MRSGAGISRSGIAARTALVVVLAGILLSAILEPGQVGASGGGIVSHKLDSSASPFEGSGFSRGQIRRAKPLPVRRLDPAAGRAASTASPAEPTGKPHYVQGSLPAGAAIGSATAQAGAGARGFGKFTSTAVTDPTVFPNTTNGKVIGKLPGVGLYTCSASVVHAKNKNTIFTAGHCVKEPGGPFAKKLVFLPAYTDGAAPLGAWSASRVFIPRAWAQGNTNYDYAAVALRRSQGRKVEKVAGSKGFAYNIPLKKKNFRAVGYPFNKGRSETMWQCVSGFGGFDPGYRRPGPSPVGIGCDMKSGASGGGWTVPGDYLASVTSFTYPRLPNRLYGPQFTKAAERLRKAAGRVKVR